MKSARKRLAAAKLRSWRVSTIRKRGQYLGTVEAPNEKAAEAAAVAEFDVSDEQRRRLVCKSGISIVAGGRKIEVARWRITNAGSGRSRSIAGRALC
jgi:hypothetical protein